MSEWQKASCVLCFNNCGFEVITEGSKIVKVRGRAFIRAENSSCSKEPILTLDSFSIEINGKKVLKVSCLRHLKEMFGGRRTAESHTVGGTLATSILPLLFCHSEPK